MVNLETLSIALEQKTPPKPPRTDLAELPEPCRGCGMEGYPAAPLSSPPCHPPCVFSPQVPLEDHVIYSGNLFQYIEENKKWRNRFCVVPHNYGLVLYENKLVRGFTFLPISGARSSGGEHPVAAVVGPCSLSSMTVFFCSGL